MMSHFDAAHNLRTVALLHTKQMLFTLKDESLSCIIWAYSGQTKSQEKHDSHEGSLALENVLQVGLGGSSVLTPLISTFGSVLR